MAEEVKILLIDDEVDFAQPMAFWLKSQGYLVKVTSNCQEALKIIKEINPDLIFLDIVMPEMDGPAVLKKIRELNKTIPVIMMSSYVEDCQSEKKLNTYGVSSIFFKADDFSKALPLIDKALKEK